MDLFLLEIWKLDIDLGAMHALWRIYVILDLGFRILLNDEVLMDEVGKFVNLVND